MDRNYYSTSNMSLAARNKNIVSWTEDIWSSIDRAVHDECMRTQVASKFLPLYIPESECETTVSSENIFVDTDDGDQQLAIEEFETNALVELSVAFRLTPQQVCDEGKLHTACCLATRAANTLSRAVDTVIFQGLSAIDGNGGDRDSLFATGKVTAKSISRDPRSRVGLLPDLDSDQSIIVPPIESNDGQLRWGENAFRAVAEAYSRLQSGVGLQQAHYGPYALVLNFEPFADSFAPLATTLQTPADRMQSLVSGMQHNPGFYSYGAGLHHQGNNFASSMNGMNGNGEQMPYMAQHPQYFGTGTLPSRTGFLISLGGCTVDLVVGMDARTEYTNQLKNGNICFRVYERFALRFKDLSSVIRFKFEGEDDGGPVIT